MRLIDAHKLQPTEQRVADIGGGMVVGVEYTLDFAEVVNAPTVEAIPIEWLEDYQMKEFIKADPSSIEFQRACGVGCAIEAWRKRK